MPREARRQCRVRDKQSRTSCILSHADMCPIHSDQGRREVLLSSGRFPHAQVCQVCPYVSARSVFFLLVTFKNVRYASTCVHAAISSFWSRSRMSGMRRRECMQHSLTSYHVPVSQLSQVSQVSHVSHVPGIFGISGISRQSRSRHLWHLEYLTLVTFQASLAS